MKRTGTYSQEDPEKRQPEPKHQTQTPGKPPTRPSHPKTTASRGQAHKRAAKPEPMNCFVFLEVNV